MIGESVDSETWRRYWCETIWSMWVVYLSLVTHKPFRDCVHRMKNQQFSDTCVKFRCSREIDNERNQLYQRLQIPERVKSPNPCSHQILEATFWPRCGTGGHLIELNSTFKLQFAVVTVVLYMPHRWQVKGCLQNSPPRCDNGCQPGHLLATFSKEILIYFHTTREVPTLSAETLRSVK
jgi:hypothetical protein